MDQALLDEIVRRVVEVAHPDRIILFGSAARGEMGPDSDIDLLVVKSGVASRGRLEEEIHLSFFGLGASVDVVVATLEDIDIFRDRPGTVIQPALEEGIEVYAA
jgi:predicted nucleotidyltransferase